MRGKLRPRKMRRVRLTIFKRDIDGVIEFLGRKSLMHLSLDEASPQNDIQEGPATIHIRETLGKLTKAALWLGLPLSKEPEESSTYPGKAEAALADTVISVISSLNDHENQSLEEKQKIEETLNEARAFSSLDASFADLDQLSYLTLRVGRLDAKRHDELRNSLTGHALIMPLGANEGGAQGSRILAATSRKGRFALDAELKKMGFVPIEIPEGYKGVPPELIASLEDRLQKAQEELDSINNRKKILLEEYGADLAKLAASYLMADIAEQLKKRLVSTQHVFLLSGWVPAELVPVLVKKLEELTEGRIAVQAYYPEGLRDVSREEIPVYVNHGSFIKGFENLVFSYGAPLYGTIDPTPIVAFSFCLIFGIMFGDVGQGMVLFLLGLLTGKRGPAFLARFRKFSIPLMSVGVASTTMGFLIGSVFTNKDILKGPTKAFTGFLTGNPVERILNILPMQEMGGSVTMLFYFFGFTLGLGVILNSIGLIINLVNLFSLRKYEYAIFSKTGLAGISFFWYALFIAVRFIFALVNPEKFNFNFYWFDLLGLLLPLAGIALGHMLWRLITGKRPLFPEGLLTFSIEGFVEILETISTKISNTVSFLRVGAFALSHAVLAYIVFWFSEEVSSTPVGTLAGILILLIGNAIIILLKGLIVAIQVVRLQYYEFFSKFFSEMGVAFTPFRFRRFQ